jgi:hypothetical protein
MTQTAQPQHMNTSQRINHVFGCDGRIVHVTPGFKLLASGTPDKCPDCGAVVYDITNTPLGQSYIAFGRIDLGNPPS